jgi:hypothetical protein
MSTVVEAYREGVALTRDSPRYLLWTVVLAAAGYAVGVGLEVLPYGVGTLVNYVVVTPLLVAVLLGLAVAGLGGSVTADAGVESAREHYPTLVGVFAVLVTLALVLMFAAALVAALLAIFVFGYRPAPGATGTPTTVDPALLTALSVVAVPAYLLAFALVQFVDVAVVVDGAGVLGAYRRTLGLCARAPGSVAAYTVVRLGTFAVGGAVALGAGRLAGALAGPTAARGATVAAGVLALSTAYAVLNAYHVVYYRRMRAGADDAG